MGCATRPSGWTTASASCTSLRSRREDGHNPLSAVQAFQRFTETIGERSDERPVTVVLHEVGSYRFLDGAGAA